MIGDRLLLTKKAYNNANEVYSQLNGHRIILIYGISGSSKSECADCLQALLFKNKRKQSLVISIDDYYNTIPMVRERNRRTIGIESVGLSEISWEALKRICKDFNDKKPLHTRRYHKYADLVEHNTLESKDLDILIFEGLYAGYMKKFGLGDLAVYLDGTPSETIEFRKKRKKENEEDPFRKQIVEKEYRTIVQLKRYADLIIPFGE